MEVAAIGMTPAKNFPWPTPYGASPDANVVTRAQAPSPMPQQNFLPLNGQQGPTQQPMQANGSPEQLTIGGAGMMNRRFPGGYGPGGQSKTIWRTQ